MKDSLPSASKAKAAERSKFKALHDSDEEEEASFLSAEATADEAEEGEGEGATAAHSSAPKRSGSTLDVDEEFQGPDTSSLAAFLLSLINIVPSKAPAEADDGAPRSLSGSSSYTEFESDYADSEAGRDDYREGEGEEDGTSSRGRQAEGRGPREEGQGQPWEEQSFGPWSEGHVGGDVGDAGERSKSEGLRARSKEGKSSRDPAGGGRDWGEEGPREEGSPPTKEEPIDGQGSPEGSPSMRWRMRHRARAHGRDHECSSDSADGSSSGGGVRRWILSRLGLASAASPSRPQRPRAAGEGEEEGGEGVSQRGVALFPPGGVKEARRGAAPERPVTAGAEGAPATGSRIRNAHAQGAEPANGDVPLGGSRSCTPSSGGQSHQVLGLPKPQSPPRLPALSEESWLLTEDMRAALFTAMPAIAQGREWVLLYSTRKHGISLATLYRKSATLSGPCMLVVGERRGATFGAFSSGTLSICDRRKYQGTSDTFVFSDISGATEVFRASGGNRYFVLCLPESLAFGGGGHFALRLEQDLLSGSSGACETFVCPQLTKEEDFPISHVELWGFAHTSKYAPQSATLQEPAAQRSFHSVL